MGYHDDDDAWAAATRRRRVQVASDVAYKADIEMLVLLMERMNAADSEQALLYQRPEDASTRGAYGHLRQALILLAGREFVEVLSQDGEVHIFLANRL